jgi:hypothetical protein
MTDSFRPDPQAIVAGLRERNELILAAGRRTQLDVIAAYEQALDALADSHQQLADASEIDWLSRVMRAAATFTREFGEASGKLAREWLED